MTSILASVLGKLPVGGSARQVSLPCFNLFICNKYKRITDKIHRTQSRAAGQAPLTPPNAVSFHGEKCCDFRLSENAVPVGSCLNWAKGRCYPFRSHPCGPPCLSASRDASRRPEGASPTRSADGRPMYIRGRGADRPDAHTPPPEGQPRQPAAPP